MQRPGLLNEINFYPKSILAKEKNFYTYSKIINCSKFITPTRKKKQISTPKKCLMLTQKHAQKESFFQTKQYFTPTWKSQFISRWNNFSLQFEKTEIPPEKNFLYYHRKSNFPTEKNYHTFQKKSDFRRKKYLIFVRKKLEVSYIYPHPHTPPSPAPLPRKKAICHTKKIEYTSF